VLFKKAYGVSLNTSNYLGKIKNKDHQCSITKVDEREKAILPEDIREKVNIKEDGKEGQHHDKKRRRSI
jgi:hypothetical protein